MKKSYNFVISMEAGIQYLCGFWIPDQAGDDSDFLTFDILLKELQIIVDDIPLELSAT